MRSRRNQVQIITDRCKGCGFCVEFCPQHALYKSTETNSKGYNIVCIDNNQKCTGCNTCSLVCPDFAISIVTARKSPGQSEVIRV
ncbi:ferredoxin family protein [Chloroflexota bacterium]